MRRGSIIGPIILILIGAAFLINNLRPDLPVLRMIGEYWPWLLVIWGVIRLVEVTVAHMRGGAVPPAGVSGGEWMFIVFLCLLGSSVFFGFHIKERWPDARIRMRGLEILGETFDYPLAQQSAPAGKTPRVLVENLRGHARIVGTDGETVTVTGRNTVRAFSQQDADKVNGSIKLEVIKQGDSLVIRTNQDRASSESKMASDLEITVPRGASIETRGRYGDIDVSDVVGTVAVDSDNAGVRLSNVGGNVRVETRKSDIVRVVNCKGAVEVKGSGNDLELENIEGQATVNGNYYGDISLRNVTKPVRFESSNTEFRAENVPGSVQFSRGEFSGDGITGPVMLRSKSKDVEISNFTAGLELTVDRGDVGLRPGRVPIGKMDVRTRSGNIDVSLPPAAAFKLKAETERGEIENEFGAALKLTNEGPRRGATLEGAVGAGPDVTLHTGRGQITVRKAGAVTPPAPPAAPKPPAAPVRTDI
jgi:hypothetical protein